MSFTAVATHMAIMKAVLFALLPDGKTTTDVFEGTGCLDRAHALRSTTKEDFPGALFAVTGDDEAADDRLQRIMAELRDPATFTGHGYEAHPGRDHEDCCK